MRITIATIVAFTSLAAIGATALANLVPSEVTTDRDTTTQMSASSTDEEMEVIMRGGQGINPFEQEQKEATQQHSNSSFESVSSASEQPSSNGGPSFYRSGEQIQTMSRSTQSSSIPANVFEEPEPQSSASSLPTEEPEIVPEEQVQTEETDVPTEEVKTAAPTQSIFRSILSQLHYIVGAIGLAIGCILLLVLKRKSSGGTNTPSQPEAPEPSGPSAVESSSERLEHALNSIDEASTSETTEGKATPPTQK